jgi:site-specific DNA recombinase
LESIGADYDAGLIDGHRYRVATDKVNTEIDEVERKIAQSSGASAAANVLASRDPAQSFRDASLMRRRAVIDALVEISLARVPRSRAPFNPESVNIEWRTA